MGEIRHFDFIERRKQNCPGRKESTILTPGNRILKLKKPKKRLKKSFLLKHYRGKFNPPKYSLYLCTSNN
jgi:hypothetical protein